MGQNNRCSSCLRAATLFLECLKLSHPVEAEEGIQWAQRLCAFPVTPRITSYSIKSQRKETLALLQLQCFSPLHTHSFGMQTWIQVQTHSIPLELPIFCIYWCFSYLFHLPLGVREWCKCSPWLSHGQTDDLFFVVCCNCLPTASLSNYFHFLPQKPNWNY